MADLLAMAERRGYERGVDAARAVIAPTFANLADLHHRTLRGSASHNPARIDSFRRCPCRSCLSASQALAALDALGGGAA